MTDLLAKGHGGQLSFDGRFVTIHRKGFLARATSGKGDKRIPIGSITAVQWKPAGPVVNGFVQFTIPGGNESRGRLGSQTSNAAHDENSVMFTRQQMPDFERIRDAVEEAMAAPAPAASPLPTAASQIAELAQLHAAGALTDDEFSSAKARVLQA